MAEDGKETPFASSDDLKARWPDLSNTEVAETLLSDASQLIRDTCPGWAHASDATLKAIVCAMVKRAMIAGSDNAGLSSTQETTGPFSQTWNFSNPTGDLYLTRAEKQRLGQGRQRAFSVSMETGTVEGQP